MKYIDKIRKRIEKFFQATENANSSTSIHTWHTKENIHAHILSSVGGTYERAKNKNSLHRYYAQVYSQHGEDGYLSEIFRRLEISKGTFIEIGAGDGLENTTRFLLESGWSGIWIESDEKNANKIRQLYRTDIESGQLKFIDSMVTIENINDLIKKVDSRTHFNLISVDIDMNTLHIWRALNLTSDVCCIEYNASLPPSSNLTVPYEPYSVWDGSNFFGASLKAIENVGRTKKMSLVSCDLQGVNSFFVRADAAPNHFDGPFTAEAQYEMPRYHLLAKTGHPPSQVRRVWEY